MKIRSLFVFFMLFVLSQNIFAQNDSLKVNKKRLYIAGGGLFAVVGASYWYVQKSWWSEQQRSFHFDDGADLTYALNVDKAGHFMGGIQSADIFSSSMKFSLIESSRSFLSLLSKSKAIFNSISSKSAFKFSEILGVIE